MVIGLSTAGQLEVHSSLHVFAKKERREADLERGREACIVELSCILEGSALGRKGLMYVLHMNTFVDSL